MSQENWQIIVVYNYGAGVVIVGQKRQREREIFATELRKQKKIFCLWKRIERKRLLVIREKTE